MTTLRPVRVSVTSTWIAFSPPAVTTAAAPLPQLQPPEEPRSVVPSHERRNSSEAVTPCTVSFAGEATLFFRLVIVKEPDASCTTFSTPAVPIVQVQSLTPGVA